MATIHDVAKRAGVSTATVSKFINKTGYISPEKRETIARAISALQYAPNRSARALKSGVSNEVSFVVPNMTERVYREILRGADAALGSNYHLVIELTNDSPERETSILRNCLNNGVAGVLLVTCCPENTALFEMMGAQAPLIFLMRRPACEGQFSFLGFNQFDAIYSLTTELFRIGAEDVGLFCGDTTFSDEAECARAFAAAHADQERKLPEKRLFSFPFSREETFRTIMRLMDGKDCPQYILTTSNLSAQAIHEVAYLRGFELGRELLLISLGEDSWYNNLFANKIITTFRDAQKLGAKAAATLRDQIATPLVFEPVSIRLEDGFAFDKIGDYISRIRDSAPIVRRQPERGRLVVAFNDGDAGTDALKSLIPQFEKVSGIHVDFKPLAHQELYETLLRCAREKSPEIDLFSVDAPWLPYLYQIGLLSDLTDFIRSSGLPEQLEGRVLDHIASCDGRILGLPYMFSLAVLFYRKDLFFESPASAAFQEKYGVPLEPPATWRMFNLIAEFFTRELNAESPTRYGTSIYGGGFPASVCSELFPRLWAYGGTAFDRRGHVRLYSPETRRAYESLFQTIRCCPPNVLNFSAFHGVQQLLSGDTAMCVFFSNNATPLADSSRNPIRQKLGFAPIPGGKPVVSGWSIGVNRYSRQTDTARDFLRWFSSIETASAYSILGGSSPMTALLEHEPLLQIYPWISVVRKNYGTAVVRDIPRLKGVPLLEEMAVEEILSSVVFDYFSGKGSLDKLLLDAHRRLYAYAFQGGYPAAASEG